MKYVSREGSLGATVDTWVALTTLGSETAPGPLFVPADAHAIKQVLVGVGDSVPTAAAVSTNIVVKLVSNFPDKAGEQIFVVDGYNNLWATAGANGSPGHMQRLDKDIAVKPNEILTVWGLATGGVCAGEPHLCVTLGFA